MSQKRSGAGLIETGVLAPLERVRPAARTSDRILEQLTAAIRALRLTPGSVISETDLAEQFQVSRTPVREAIARLAEVGLVNVVPQVDTRVSLIRLSDVEEAQFVREHLEVAAFKVACRKAQGDVSTLRAIIHDQQVACDASDLDGFFRADEAMHEHIFAISGFPGAWQAVQRMKLQLDRLRRLSLPDGDVLAELLGEHTLIVDALEQNAVAEGVGHIERHTRRVLVAAPSLRQQHPEYFALDNETTHQGTHR